MLQKKCWKSWMLKMENNQSTKCGFVAVIGAPNAGKSTIVNHFVGSKVSIVSPKVQTTRTQVKGIGIVDNSQIVFIDTPGIFKPKRRLDRAMVANAWGGAQDGDLVVLVMDVKRGLCDEVKSIIEGLKSQQRKAILVLNKTDLIKKEKLLELSSGLFNEGVFSDVFMVSAKSGDGLEDLYKFIADKVPNGPWLYDEDQISDMPLKMLAAEIVREKLFLNLQQELPYSLTVESDKWERKKDGSVRVEQTIYVERDSQKSIILGAKGSMVKKIGMEARKELENLLEEKIHLFLFVKVRKNWQEDPSRYSEWGLDFNS